MTRTWRIALPLIALWIGLAIGLAAIKTRVDDGCVRSDELLYERLARSVWPRQR